MEFPGASLAACWDRRPLVAAGSHHVLPARHGQAWKLPAGWAQPIATPLQQLPLAGFRTLGGEAKALSCLVMGAVFCVATLMHSCASRSRRSLAVGRTRAKAVKMVLEMFSGIGGMRVAFELAMASLAESFGSQWSPASSLSWRALEVDRVCCAAYAEIFDSAEQTGVSARRLWKQAAGQNEVWSCSIDRLPVDAFEGACLWLLSPPCQPFTRTGRQDDLGDPRCAALRHLVKALPRLRTPPQALLVENVPEFQASAARELLLHSLRDNGYVVQEHVLDPTDFGYPNTRRRYYCVATGADVARDALPAVFPAVPVQPLRAFCRSHPSHGVSDLEAMRVPARLLERLGPYTLDVGVASSLATKTFTAGYGKSSYGGLVKAGPVLLTADPGSWAPAEKVPAWLLADAGNRSGSADGTSCRFCHVGRQPGDWPRLRYFSPDEAVRTHGGHSLMPGSLLFALPHGAGDHLRADLRCC